MTKISAKKYATNMLHQYGKEETIREINQCIWLLASYTIEGKVITSSYGNENQIKFWARVLIEIRKISKD